MEDSEKQPRGNREILTTDEEFVTYCRTLAAEEGLSGFAEILVGDAPVEVQDISGNINRVRRLSFGASPDTRSPSLVIKHVPSGGALERYPQIIFPEDRLRYEAHFYEQVDRAASTDLPALKGFVPAVLHDDPDREILVLQDLAPDRPMEAAALEGIELSPHFFETLGRSIGSLHDWSRRQVLPARLVSNPSAEANRPYVLTLCLQEPEAIRSVWMGKGGEPDRVLLQERFLATYGARVLARGEVMARRFKDDPSPVMTHGDLHGESLFVRPGDHPTVIDAELCDQGAGWFDAGMCLAHLLMLSRALERSMHGAAFLRAYLKFARPKEPSRLASDALIMAGLEMVRRIIGAANAPFVEGAELRWQLLEEAARMVLAPGQTELYQEVLS